MKTSRLVVAARVAHISVYPAIYLTLFWVLYSANQSGLEVTWKYAGPPMLIGGVICFLIVGILSAMYAADSTTSLSSTPRCDTEEIDETDDVYVPTLVELDNDMQYALDELADLKKQQAHLQGAAAVIAVGVFAYLAIKSLRKSK